MNRVYPNRIVPHSQWHILNHIDVKEHISNFFAIRLQESSNSTSISDRQKNKYKSYFPAKRFYDGISTILLSSQYRKRDVHWHIKNKDLHTSLLSNNQQPMFTKMNIDDYKWRKKRRNFIGIRLSIIHTMCVESKTLSTNGFPTNISINGLTTNIKKYCFLFKHEPTICNFWHCNIFVAAILQDESLLILNEKQEYIPQKTVDRIAKKLRDNYMSDDMLKNSTFLKEYYLPKKMYKTY